MSQTRSVLVTVHTDVSREVFSRVFRENPELSGAKRSFLPFLCIAKRVAGHGVNSNQFYDLFTVQQDICGPLIIFSN